MIRFLYSSKGHEFMKGKLLKPEQGTITHSVFGATQADDGGDAGGDED